jgi:hypothetical protein
MPNEIPTREELIDAILQVKTENPQFGVKRIWSRLKETRSWEVSEKRIMKFLKEEPILQIAANAIGVEAGSANPSSIGNKDNKLYGCEIRSERPSPRAYISLCLHPTRPSTLLLFGGEHYNGVKNSFYNDVYFLDTADSCQWYRLSLPDDATRPDPRSAHQAWIWNGSMYILGGERSSPAGHKFRVLNDLWRLDLSALRWHALELAGGPSPRSGHRVAVVGDRAVLYGGLTASKYCQVTIHMVSYGSM